MGFCGPEPASRRRGQRRGVKRPARGRHRTAGSRWKQPHVRRRTEHGNRIDPTTRERLRGTHSRAHERIDQRTEINGDTRGRLEAEAGYDNRGNRRAGRTGRAGNSRQPGEQHRRKQRQSCNLAQAERERLRNAVHDGTERDRIPPRSNLPGVHARKSSQVRPGVRQRVRRPPHGVLPAKRHESGGAPDNAHIGTRRSRPRSEQVLGENQTVRGPAGNVSAPRAGHTVLGRDLRRGGRNHGNTSAHLIGQHKWRDRVDDPPGGPEKTGRNLGR